jgi:hypothetical protein
MRDIYIDNPDAWERLRREEEIALNANPNWWELTRCEIGAGHHAGPRGVHFYKLAAYTLFPAFWHPIELHAISAEGYSAVVAALDPEVRIPMLDDMVEAWEENGREWVQVYDATQKEDAELVGGINIRFPLLEQEFVAARSIITPFLIRPQGRAR